MEDIICPQCGRPNLIEAEKCWYCQTSLQDIKSSEMESPSADLSDGNISTDGEGIANSNEGPEQDLPEWLKRVRELKEADQPPEEEEPSWEQQDLFKTEKNKKLVEKKPSSRKESAQKEIKSEKKNDNPAEFTEKIPYTLPKKNSAGDIEKVETESTDQEDDALSTDLPEGFTKL
ncbi:MAG: zinc ribbon domain-containing protein [Pelolinea sp.]|nr:zinc ribbon domain-containing protein [Pelolinea sp.]